MARLPAITPEVLPGLRDALHRFVASELQAHGVSGGRERLPGLLQERPVIEFMQWLDATALRLGLKLQDAAASGEDETPVRHADDVGVVVAEPPAAQAGCRLTLRLANATAGAGYEQPVDELVSADDGRRYRLVTVHGLDGSGLVFDADASRLTGSPQAHVGRGEDVAFPASFRALDEAEDAALHAGQIVLLVNPDPRSLWKQREPDVALGLRKPHAVSFNQTIDGARLVAASLRGRSHANAGAFREDDVAVSTDRDGRWLVAAVADGAGSAALSRRGSEIATQRAVSALVDQLEVIEHRLRAQGAALDDIDAAACAQLAPQLLAAFAEALAAVGDDLQRQARALHVDDAALATTLMLVAVRPCGAQRLVAGYWVGDGALALFDPSAPSLRLLGNPDSGEYAGQTRFFHPSASALDVEGVRPRFQCALVPASTKVVAMTDGVSDPKFASTRALQDAGVWQRWYADDLIAADAPDGPGRSVIEAAALLRYLGFWCPGEHDDRTLAIID